jgi:hypothetical protein
MNTVLALQSLPSVGVETAAPNVITSFSLECTY